MKDIKTPEQLLDFMANINYNDLGKDWYQKYKLKSKEELLDTLSGNCLDQVELERDWFISNGYEIKTFFEIVLLNYENDYPTHAFLVYKDNNKWCWFENSDSNNRGIHKFNTLDELLNYQYNKYLEYLKTFNIKEKEIEKIIVKEFNKPKDNISAEEYLNHVLCS